MEEKTGSGKRDGGGGKGSVTVVGIGPGGLEHLTAKAVDAITSADVVVGYTRYVSLVSKLTEGKEVFATGMTHEVERCEKAVELAHEGKKVAVVSSGDAGIYGMAGLVLQISTKESALKRVDVDVVPGVPAFVAAAAILGAPLMHDFASISLSDLLTPWSKITERLEAAARADFVIALYNPRSSKRTEGLGEAVDIIARHRGPDTPAGIVRNATREAESTTVTTLSELKGLCSTVDMLTIIIIGNSTSFASGERIITPRGYRGV